MLSKKPVLVVLSLVIAVFLWAYVIGEVDPETKTKISYIGVQFENVEELNNHDLAVTELDSEYVVSATIKGKRSVVNDVNASNIKAHVDVSKAHIGQNELPVIYDTPAGISIEASTTTQVINVDVEARIDKEVPVKITFTESTDSSTIPWATEYYPETVKVYGPESSILKTKMAIGNIDASHAGLTAKTLSVDIEGADASGKVVRGVTCERDSISATIKRMSYKEVPVEISCQHLDKQYKVADNEGLTIKVLGDKGALEDLTSVKGVADLSDVNRTGRMDVAVSIETPYGVYVYGEPKKSVQIAIQKNDN